MRTLRLCTSLAAVTITLLFFQNCSENLGDKPADISQSSDLASPPPNIPSLQLQVESVRTSPTASLPGATFHFSVDVLPLDSVSGMTVNVMLYGPANNLIAGQTFPSQDFSTGVTQTYNIQYTSLKTLPAGHYTAAVLVRTADLKHILFSQNGLDAFELGAPIRVAAGSPRPVTDSQGNVWAADTFNASGSATIPTFPFNVQGTSDPAVYQTDRVGIGAGLAAIPITYTFKVPGPGGYRVTTYFSENDGNIIAPNQRIFDIAINGNTVLQNFDIVAVAGANLTAVTKGFDVNVPNGSDQIQITFKPGAAYYPKVNSFSILGE
jgi:hypothetical protein